MVHIKKGRKVALVAGLALVVLSVVMGWTYWEEIRFFLNFERLGKNAQRYAEYRHRDSGIVFVSLPGGTFTMGSTEDEEKRDEDEGPVHEVKLSRFMIAKYEVNQVQWENTMGVGTVQFHFNGVVRPVDRVSWNDLHAEGGFLEKTGLALPTEAQWEYACRAGTTGPIAGTGNMDDMGWYSDHSGNTTHPVGLKQPNQFGIHDMHGNVWEWCEDVYDEAFYSRPNATEPDPVCMGGTESRVQRGGAFHNSWWGCRSATRTGAAPDRQIYIVGFRPIALLPPF